MNREGTAYLVILWILVMVMVVVVIVVVEELRGISEELVQQDLGVCGGHRYIDR